MNFDIVATGFDDSFGFYITASQHNTFYSEDSLIPYRNPQALIYQGEDLAFDVSDKEFQNLVVMVKPIRPVTEPTTMIISSIFLFGGVRVPQAVYKHLIDSVR